jgi:hypothetical protein
VPAHLPSGTVSTGRVLAYTSAAVAFLAVSFAVARWLTQDNRERDAVTDLLRAQAHGDVAAMLALLDGCAANSACLARVTSNAKRLRRGGKIEIVRYDSSTAHALSSESGPTRVAWGDGTKAAIVVQCVEVERRGFAPFGADIVLSSIGAPIGGESACSR